MALTVASADLVDKGNQIIQLYNKYLGRDPLQGGLDYWIGTGETIEQIESNIAISKEAQVVTAFKEGAGRLPDNDERQFLVNEQPQADIGAFVSQVAEEEGYDPLADTVDDDTTSDAGLGDTTSDDVDDSADDAGPAFPTADTGQYGDMIDAEATFADANQYLGVNEAQWTAFVNEVNDIKAQMNAFEGNEARVMQDRSTPDALLDRRIAVLLNQNPGMTPEEARQQAESSPEYQQMVATNQQYEALQTRLNQAYASIGLDPAGSITGSSVSVPTGSIDFDLGTGAITVYTKPTTGAFVKGLITAAATAGIASALAPAIASSLGISSAVAKTAVTTALNVATGQDVSISDAFSFALNSLVPGAGEVVDPDIAGAVAGAIQDYVTNPDNYEENEVGQIVWNTTGGTDEMGNPIFNIPDFQAIVDANKESGGGGDTATASDTSANTSTTGGADASGAEVGAADPSTTVTVDSSGGNGVLTGTTASGSGTTDEPGQFTNVEFYKVENGIIYLPSYETGTYDENGVWQGDWEPRPDIANVKVQTASGEIVEVGSLPDGTYGEHGEVIGSTQDPRTPTEKSDLEKATEWILVNLPNYGNMTEEEINVELENAGLNTIDYDNDGTIATRSEVAKTGDDNDASTVTVAGNGNGNGTINGGGGSEVPAKGTVLGQGCEGTDYVIRFADGQGGETVDRLPNYSYCQTDGNGTGPDGTPDGPPNGDKVPAAGTVLGQGCEGPDYVMRFADGKGGETVERISNYSYCTTGPSVTPNGQGPGKGPGDGPGDNGDNGLDRTGMLIGLALPPTMAAQPFGPLSKTDIRIQAEAVPEVNIQAGDPLAQIARLAFAPHADKPSGVALDGLLTSLTSGKSNV